MGIKKIILEMKKMDWLLFIFALLLAGVGLVVIYSSSLSKGDFFNFKKQIIFLFIGLLLMFLLSFFDWRVFRDDPYLILIFYIFCLFLLIGLFFWAPEIRGVRGWYKIGEFSFDPIELTKIILIILLAKYFSTRHVEMYRFRHIVLSGFYVLLPSLLIFFQPNLGSVLVILSLWIGILMVSGIKLKHFFILFLVFFILFLLSWNTVLKDYQKERIISFIQPHFADPLKIGWSQNQAKIAIGSGGFLGKGFGKGSQTQYGFLPEPQTDFTFAAIAEEFGLIGVVILFFLFFLLFWRIFKISFLAKSNFPRLFAVGFAISVFSQFFIHIGMNLGLLPIIGIPLPLVSYGGSNLIMTFVGLGILQSICYSSVT